MKNRGFSIMAGVIVGFAGMAAAAATPPATSLNNCQAAVKTATKAFVTNKVAAIGACLQAVSTQIVKNNKADAGAAAATCVAAFRKLNDTRGLGKQLSDKLGAAITKKCDPSYQTPGGAFPNTHTLADVIGSGAGVPQPLGAENLSAWCRNFGGSDSVASIAEWTSCIAVAAECGVDAAVAVQYPRVLEWLNLAKTAMNALPVSAPDPTKVTDAVAGLTAVQSALDPDGDNRISIRCGRPSQVLKTGQTNSYGPGTDGNLGLGAARSFTDNGDGTITDNITGLMWEKKDFAGGVHDQYNTYTWSTGGPAYLMDGTIATDFLATLNAGSGFAGYTDWRIPNAFEMITLSTAGSQSQYYPAFNQNCSGPSAFGCTVLTCSCAQLSIMWTSTTLETGGVGGSAFWAFTGNMRVQFDAKTVAYSARAVRGGR